MSEPHRPLPHLEQRLSAWRCGCPAAPSTCHRQPNALFHFPTMSRPSPRHRTRHLHLHPHLGLRDRWTQDQWPHSPLNKCLSFCHPRCSRSGVAVAGQWAWLLLSPLDDLSNHCTPRQPADLQREGWEDTGNDDRRGEVVVVVREVCLHTALTTASVLYVPHACSRLVPHCHRQHTLLPLRPSGLVGPFSRLPLKLGLAPAIAARAMPVLLLLLIVHGCRSTALETFST